MCILVHIALVFSLSSPCIKQWESEVVCRYVAENQTPERGHREVTPAGSDLSQTHSHLAPLQKLLVLDKDLLGIAMATAHDSLSREALEMKFGQLHIDYDSQAEELGVLLDRVKSAAASLHYLRSKSLLAVSGLPHGSLAAEQLELVDNGSVCEVSKDQDSLAVEDTWKMIQSIQMVSAVLESLLRRVKAAEYEASFQKERVLIGEEEIRRKTVQIENMSLRLEEMKQIVHENKDVLEETVEIIKKLVEDSRRDREKAVENEEELRRVKTEVESLRNYVNTSTNAVETLLSSERQFQTIEARLVAKSAQLEGEKAQKEVEVQKLMEENLKLSALLDKKEAQILALNEQCKFMALNDSNI